MEISEIVESHTSSLVREYLHRKGLINTLNTFDIEFPRTSMSINSSSSLIRSLGMEDIIGKDRVRGKSYKSILEVIVHKIKIGDRSIKGKHHCSPSLLTLSHLKNLHNMLNERGQLVDFLSLIKMYCGCWTAYSSINWSELGRTNFSTTKQKNSNGKPHELKRNENGEATIEFDDKFYYTQKEPQVYNEKESSTLTEKQNVLKSYLLNQETDLGTCDTIELGTKHSCDIQQLETTTNSPTLNNKRKLNSSRSTSSPTRNVHYIKEPSNETIPLNEKDKVKMSSFDTPSIILIEENKNETKEVLLNYLDKTPSNKNDIKSTTSLEGELKNDLICKTTKEEELKLDNYSLIKKILHANNKIISKKWMGVSFILGKKPFSYGMIQMEEECSGVLATVNAHVIKELLYSDLKNDVDCLRPDQSQLLPALTKAFLEILWQAGRNSATIAALNNGIAELKSIEDVLDNSNHKVYLSKNDLQAAINENISSFTQEDGHGCLLLLISVILSRGVENVIDDMNGVPSLIDSNGFSSLELVNLMLTGRAVSNVFDNDIQLKYNTIKGIIKRSDIGYLSIKEHFKCCKVGSYLKTPRFPIWIVHNEKQFTVLFSCQKQLLSDWKVERKFVLYHYNSLKGLGEEISLTIDTTHGEEAKNLKDTMKVSIEHCVRTKWKDANILWK